MINSAKKTNWLTIFLIIFLLLSGFFAYQWWQVKGELARQIEQNENLKNQVTELQAEIDKLKKEIEGLKTAEGEITDETAEWKSYKNELMGFEVKYPSDWKIREVPPHITFAGNIPVDRHTTLNCSLNIIGIAQDRFEEYKQKEVNDLKAKGWEESKATVGGIPTIKLTHPEFSTWVEYFLKTEKGNFSFDLLFDTSKSSDYPPFIEELEVPECQPIFDQMLSSLRFTEKY